MLCHGMNEFEVEEQFVDKSSYFNSNKLVKLKKN